MGRPSHGLVSLMVTLACCHTFYHKRKSVMLFFMHTRVIVLAAGKGTRMQSDMPKVLVPLNGRPMIQYLLDAIRASGVDARPVLVVGHQSDMVRQAIGDTVDYVEQKEQLGTGHAVRCAESLLAGKAENIIVLYGDHPFVRSETIAALNQLHEREGCVLSMMTAIVEDFNGWRAPFADFSRVIRDASGHIVSIAEVKDATPAERLITEVNPAFFAFKASWLWDNLKRITDKNAKGEYYLTDLVGMAMQQGETIASMAIDPSEAIGVNTRDHLMSAGFFAQ